jgi:MATE family, multidrug efflux pump
MGIFPYVGWTGLAIGATSGHCVGGMIILFRLARQTGVLNIREAPGGWSVDWPTVQRILRIGVPGGTDIWAVLACHLAYAAIINSLGTLAQAAHGLGLQIEAMSYLPGSAFSVAAATIAGQSLGAADQRRAVRGVLLCAGCAVAIMTTTGALMFFCGESIALFFTGDRDELAVFVGRLLKIVAISCPALGLLMVMLGALRGAGDTRLSLAITLIGLVGIRLPGACFLAWDQVPIPFTSLTIPGAGLGVAGAWTAMVTDVIVRSLLAVARFAEGGWKKVRV